MGDLRGTYRFLVPSIVDAGFRVAWTDLRGHGDSDATSPATATWTRPATSSLSWRNWAAQPRSWATPWAPVPRCSPQPTGPSLFRVSSSWARSCATGKEVHCSECSSASFWHGRGSLPPGRPTCQAVCRSPTHRLRPAPERDRGQPPQAGPRQGLLLRPGRSLTTRTSHRQAESRLGEVAKPVLVVMGEQDPDFPDPKAEAQRIAGALRPRVVMVADAGHYPQSQQPAAVTSPVLEFLPNTDKAQRLEGVFG